jgi:hypothetical protein
LYLIAICSCGKGLVIKGRNKGNAIYVSSVDMEVVLGHFINNTHRMVWAEDVTICR